jgi:hypothetical protein
MECKNCTTNLRTDYSYCPDCGAKVIRNRITFKNLFYDIIERYFNLDNSFINTFLHLFSKPEKVINGYITGTRKKYLNPISYLGIALTLSGITVFLIKKFFKDSIDFTNGTDMNVEFAQQYTDAIFDYSSLFFLLYFPVLALPAYLIFNKVKYNFSEYILVFIYVMAQYSIVSFPLTISTLVVDAESYLKISQPILYLTLAYCIYVLQKLNKFSTKAFLGRSLLYIVCVVVLFFGLIIAIMIALFALGVLNLEDFAPK